MDSSVDSIVSSYGSYGNGKAMNESMVSEYNDDFASLSPPTHALLVLANLVSLHFQIQDGSVMRCDLGRSGCGL